MVGSEHSHMHAYWMGALVWAQGLRETKTRVPNIVIMCRQCQSVPPIALEAFKRLNATIMPIESMQHDKLFTNIPGTWKSAFDKLNVWKLTQFEKVLFMDADTLVVQNIDHLFNEPELSAPPTPKNCQADQDFALYPNYYTISSGFFICVPSVERWNQMLDLASKPSPDPEDLEQFNGTWHWGDQQMLRVVFQQLENKWNPLPWVYDLPIGLCSSPRRRTQPVYSYHFVCSYPVPKPWSDPIGPLFDVDENKPDCVIEIYMLWFRLFAKAMNEHSDPFNTKKVIQPRDLYNNVDWL